MIPLLLLVLGIGTALTVYELSPGARTSVDDYARVLRAAHAAHAAADGHLAVATAAAATVAAHVDAISQVPPPAPRTPPTPAQVAAAPQAAAAQAATDMGVDHAVAAMAANQAAAQNTAVAAQVAQTPDQKAAVAASADAVTARQQQITTALVNLGVGQCGVHSYPKVTPGVKDKLIARLHSEGMDVTGDNPWNIETHKYSVRLRALWDPQTAVLRIIVTAGQGGLLGLVTCDEIWGRIDPIVKDVSGS